MTHDKLAQKREILHLFNVEERNVVIVAVVPVVVCYWYGCCWLIVVLVEMAVVLYTNILSMIQHCTQNALVWFSLLVAV